MNIICKIKDIMPYSLPIKVALGFILTTLGSASVLGLLSEFAVYKYALANGFRVPVEGIAYLKPTVTFVSLIILLVSLACFTATYFFAKVSVALFLTPEIVIRKLFKSKVVGVGKLRSASTKRVLLSSLGMSIVATVTMSLLVNSNINIPYSLEELMRNNFGIELLDTAYKKVTLFIISFVIYFSTFRPKYIKHIAFGVAGSSVVFILMIMFNGKLYSEFLNLTGFGGERNITLFTKENSYGVDGKLLIKSNDYYILTLESGNVVEFPISKVDRVEYFKGTGF